MVQQVMTAIRQAFDTDKVEDHLSEANGRVFGRVTVLDSPTFDKLDDVRRQALLWKNLDELLGNESIKVGPVVLEPRNRG